MSDKARWIIFVVTSLVLALGIGTLIYFQDQQIDELHQTAANLRTKIDKDRALITKTPDLVKEVIIQRETDAIVKEILSDEQDVNDLVRTLNKFGLDSGVSITGLKKQKAAQAGRQKEQFDRVGYTLEFEGNAFELLAFTDLVESHARFMSVTRFKLSAARKGFDTDVEPRHRVQLDLETYVYKPTEISEEVRIDNYLHKRDLLVSEISKRGADLRIPTYDYRGPRGRRDPWVDPRMPAEVDGIPTPTIEEQIAMVEELVNRADEAEALWKEAEEADNLIAEMKARAKLEEALALLSEAVRRIEEDGQLIYVPSRNRFEKQVVDRLLALRNNLDDTKGGFGPSVAELEETVATMERFIRGQDYELALETFSSIEPRLATIPEFDDVRQPYVLGLHEFQRLAQTVLEFESIKLEVTGIAIVENERPVALINGQAVSEGEILGDELFVRNIQRDRIEFAYRGLVLARPIDHD